MSKILIVDDEPHTIEMFKFRLESSGYSVDVASSGIDALKRIGENRPDLILLDVMMPHIDGYEVCRRIKADKKTKDIPIVIFTAVGHDDLAKRSMDAGASSFITKPFDGNALLQIIKKVLK